MPISRLDQPTEEMFYLQNPGLVSDLQIYNEIQLEQYVYWQGGDGSRQKTKWYGY